MSYRLRLISMISPLLFLFGTSLAQTTIDQQLFLVENEGGTGGNFRVAVQVKGNDLPEANTLNSATIDVVYDNDILKFNDATGWAFGSADGYTRSANPIADSTAIRILILGTSVGNDGPGEPPGYDIETEYDTWVILNFTIFDETAFATLTIDGTSNDISLFDNYQNNPNTGANTSYPLNPPIIIENESLAPPDIFNITGTVDLLDGFGNVEDAIISYTSTIDGAGTVSPNESGFYSFQVTGGTDVTITPTLAGYTFDPEIRSGGPLNDVSSDVSGQDFDGLTDRFVITGEVTGDTFAGVTITASGDVSDETITDENGLYTFEDVPYGATVTLTPEMTGYTFDPPSDTIENITQNESAAPFIAAINTYTIAGTITGDTQEDVDITLEYNETTLETTSNIDGVYEFDGIPFGSDVTVTPSRTGFTFDPIERVITDIDDDIQDADFAAIINTYIITTSVDPEGAGSVTGDGEYEHGQTVVLSASPNEGYTFDQWTENGDVVSTDEEYTFTATGNRDLVAVFSFDSYTISGEITGDTQEDVTVTAVIDGIEQTVVTGSDGTYAFTDIEHGSEVTVTPSKTGYTFDPVNLYIEELTGNVTQNFNASVITYTISGRVTGGMMGNILITVTGDGFTTTTTTNQNGNYSVSGIPHGLSGTITPSRPNFAFSPKFRAFENITGNLTNQDFLNARIRLEFTVEPTNAIAGETIAPPVEVSVLGVNSEIESDFNGSIQVALFDNPGDASLNGTTVVNAVEGIATFPDLNITVAETGYTLQATTPDTGFSPDTSQSFDITHGNATHIVLEGLTTDLPAGTEREFTARIKDIHDNLVTTGPGSELIVTFSRLGGSVGTMDGLPADVTASGGIASVTAVAQSAGLFRLRAISDGPVSDTIEFDIIPGPATILTIEDGSPQETVVGNAFPTLFQVKVTDDYLNPVEGTLVTFTPPTSGAGGTFADGENTAITNGDGIATAAQFTANQTAGTYTVTASASETNTENFSLTNNPDAPSELAIDTIPNQLVGAPFDVTVRLTDQFGNLSPNSGSSTINLSVAEGEGDLSGTTSGVIPDGNSIVTISGVIYDTQDENVVIRATGSGGSADGLNQDSNPFNVSGTQLMVSADPVSPVVGQQTTLTAAVVDAQNEPVTGIDVIFSVESGSGSYSGNTTIPTNDQGIAAIDYNVYTIVENAILRAELVAAPAVFDTLHLLSQADTATKLVYLVQPSNTAAGQTIAPPIEVNAQDQYDNINLQFTGDISVDIDENPGLGTLSGTTVRPAQNGVAVFDDLSIDMTGTGYTMQSTAAGLTAAISQPFNITTGQAVSIEYTSGDNQTGEVTSQLDDPMVVTVRDGSGNPVAGITVEFSITGTPPDATGQSLSVSSVETNSDGQASTFLTLGNKTGEYEVEAASGDLSGSPVEFTATGLAADPVAITIVSGTPQSTTVGTDFDELLSVVIRDVHENPVPGVDVTFSAPTTGASGTFNGNANAVVTTGTDGIASAPAFTANTTAGSYVVTAGAAGLESVQFSLTNTPGPADKIVFDTIPTQLVGQPFDVTITLTDEYDNPVENSGASTITITVSSGSGNVSGTTSGIIGDNQTGVTISGLIYDTQEPGVVLQASGSGGSANGMIAFSNEFEVAGSQLVLTADPASPVVGQPTTLTATVTDAQTEPLIGVEVEFLIDSGNGSYVGETIRQTDTQGQVTILYTTFTTVENAVLKAELVVSPGVSDTVHVLSRAEPATKLVFAVQPSNTIAGQTITPALEISALDQYDNIDLQYTDDVNIAIAANPGNGELSGTTTRPAQNGIAIFNDLSIDKAGNGYTLQATSGTLTSVTSEPFNIQTGDAGEIVIVSGDGQEGLINSPLEEPFIVEVRDTQGNPVAGVEVTFAISSIPDGATGQELSVTSDETDTDGRTSTVLTMGDRAGVYEVTASTDGLAPAVFTASVPAYTISGTVLLHGSGLQNVDIIVGGGIIDTLTTGGNGGYAVQNIPAGTGTIILTPERSGFIFDPASRTIDGPVTSDITDQNFDATAIVFTITGTVIKDDEGFEGVNVVASGGHNESVLTNENGQFIFSNVAFGATNITLTPSKEGHGFSPSNYVIQGPVEDDLSGITFIASAIGYTISGTITEAGTGLQGVQVSATGGFEQTVVTNVSGNYSVSGIPFGTTNILITPSHPGHEFAPPDTLISGPVTGNIPNVNFVTTPPPAPQLVSPANGAFDLDISLTLMWDEADRADTYGIQVATTDDFTSGIVVNESGLTGISYEITLPEYGTTYYWRVNAENTSGLSEWSEVWNFTTIASTMHNIALQAGWNMISSFVEPFSDSISVIFENIIDNLIIVKDGDGKIYMPHFDIDQIGTWKYSEGYQVYVMPDPDTLGILGIQLQPENTPVELTAGWNMKSYLRNNPMSADTALQSIEDKLIIAKNGAGEVYIPPDVVGPNPINTIGDMKPGDGYQMYLTENAELLYPANGEPAGFIAKTPSPQSDRSAITGQSPVLYILERRTDNNATLIVTSEDLLTGDEIGVWNETGTLVGSGVVQGNMAVMTIWGRDGFNEESDFGLASGEKITMTVWSPEGQDERNIIVSSTYNVVTGTFGETDIHYRRDAVLLAEVEIEANVPDKFILFQNYPNPFNAVTTIEYGLATDTDVLLEVYNILGQRVKVLVNEQQNAGMYQTVFNGSNLASGTYFYRIQAGDFVDIKKFVLLK